MNQFKGLQCSVCHQIFDSSDDIVVCPDCGTPHHRSCYKENNQCVNTEKHASGYTYEFERPAYEQREQYQETNVKCPRCAAFNPGSAIFCSNCGFAMNGNESAKPFFASGMMDFSEAAYRPDEKIDDLTIEELSAYLGPNSYAFISKFKRMNDTKKPFSVNWCAMLLTGVYGGYRRQYFWAVVINILMFIFFIPYFIYTMPDALSRTNDMLGLSYSLRFDVDSAWFSAVYMLSSLGSFAIRFLYALFFDKLYMNNTFKKIRKIKAVHGEKPEYKQILAQAGGVKTAGGVLIILMMTLLMLAATTVTVMFFVL